MRKSIHCALGLTTWHTSHTFGSLDSKLGTPHTLLALWIQNLAHLTQFWLFGFKTLHTSHTFGPLGLKLGTPHTLLPLWTGAPCTKCGFFTVGRGAPCRNVWFSHSGGGLGGHTCFSHVVTLAKNPCRPCIELLCKITKCCQIENFSKIL